MRARWVFCLLYFAFWVGFFVLGKLSFLAYHASRTRALDTGTVLGVLSHGLKMDISAAAYACFLPCLAVALTAPFSTRLTAYVIGIYTGLAVVLVSFLIVLDLELFAEWGHRLDNAVLLYLNTPVEMVASAGSSSLWLLAPIFLVLTTAGLVTSFRWLVPRIRAFPGVGVLSGALLLPALLPLVIGGRGGVHEIPIKQSSVYFSANNFANQAAINPVWNFFDSVRDYERKKPLAFQPPPEAARLVDDLLRQSDERTVLLLKTTRPNVILIIWESLTAKVVERLGGRPGVTPELERFISEGVLFNHFYASGDRSAKGLVALLSGYPAPPRSSMMKTPWKTQRLPFLSRDLAATGYHCAFYYGGELDFANLRAYVSKGEFRELVGKHSFAPSDWSSRWGAHDHVVLERLLTTVRRAPEPFFHTVFTLSSHEPFDVPGPTVFAGEDKLTKFLNAHHYTDASIGRFIEQARREPWWERTLIIVTADHGHRLPVPAGGSAFEIFEQAYRIPMLWMGGAVARPGLVVSQLGVQTDLPRTLLAQLGLNGRHYPWSWDLLAPGARPFAYYTFNGGFSYLTDRGGFLFNTAAQRVVAEGGAVTEQDRRSGLAYAQVLYQDYLDQ